MDKRLKVLSSSVLTSSLLFTSLGVDKIEAIQKTEPVKVVTVEDSSGDSMGIYGVNQLANDNKLILFNDTFSYYTETKKGSMEVILEKNGLNTYRVVKVTDGDSPIPEDGLVLSTGITTSTEIRNFLNQLRTGETITLFEPTEKRVNMQSQAVNPTKESNPIGAPFDGYRGPDQLIVYTPEFGETTKTNQYGYEITVENGFVTKLGGGGSNIPKNGFVVSGHGIASNWISSNSIIGAMVTVDQNGVVEIVQDVESIQFQCQQAINQAKASMDKAKAEYLSVATKKAEKAYKKAVELLKKAELLKSSNQIKSLDLTRQSTQLAYDAYYYSLPSNKAEQRAIWYRPEETTLEGVKQVVDRMEKAGFNSVYLETTFHGYTIYPSKTMESYGFPSQHPRFNNADYGPYGKDLLEAYIKEGKKRGLSIQAWTDGFMVGESSLGIPPEIEKHPEWAAIQRNNQTGKPAPDSSSKYYWLDIAQPDVQKFMLNIYNEMEKTYDIKGLNIDYMRYPHQSFEKSYGFSETVRNMYKKETGTDPYDINPTTDPQKWADWLKWIETKENEFVDKLHTQSKSINPKFMLTATPEPGPEAALINGWKDDIDGVIPQAYGHDFNSIQKTVLASKALMPEGTMYYTGIYSFYHHLSEMASVNDVMSAAYGTSGVNMFAFGQASAPSVDALGKGPWREKSVNPGEEPIEATQTVLKEIEKQIETIYVPQGAVDYKQGNAMKLAINQLKKTVSKDPAQSATLFNTVITEIDQAAQDNELNLIVADRMKEQLQEANSWVKYSLTHQK